MKFYLQSDETFSMVISAGKDRCIYVSDPRSSIDGNSSRLLCEESAPVLRMLLTPDHNSLWVSTTESHVKEWVCVFFISSSLCDVPISERFFDVFVFQALGRLLRENWNHGGGNLLEEPYMIHPERVLEGGPSIIQYHILNDKRHILTKDTEGNVALYDVLKV